MNINTLSFDRVTRAANQSNTKGFTPGMILEMAEGTLDLIKQHGMPVEGIWSAANHEAGHAVVAQAFGYKVKSCDVSPEGTGYTSHTHPTLGRAPVDFATQPEDGFFHLAIGAAGHTGEYLGLGMQAAHPLNNVLELEQVRGGCRVVGLVTGREGRLVFNAVCAIALAILTNNRAIHQSYTAELARTNRISRTTLAGGAKRVKLPAKMLGIYDLPQTAEPKTPEEIVLLSIGQQLGGFNA
jgi:hypothetical protein